MQLKSTSSRLMSWIPVIVVSVAAFLALPVSVWSEPEEKLKAKQPTKPAAKGRADVTRHVDLIEGSTLRVRLLDATLRLKTRYGDLTIPTADIQRIEFETRIPDAVAKRIDAAIGDLGSKQLQRREAAATELLRQRVRAVPALRRAGKNSNSTIAKAAGELLEKLRETVAEEALVIRQHDVVHTADSKITGEIVADSLSIHTEQFGKQQLKLTDLRVLRSSSASNGETNNNTLVTAKTKLKAGQSILVHWGNRWWDGNVVQVMRDGRVLISYVGFGAASNEIVPRSRLQLKRVR